MNEKTFKEKVEHIEKTFEYIFDRCEDLKKYSIETLHECSAKNLDDLNTYKVIVGMMDIFFKRYPDLITKLNQTQNYFNIVFARINEIPIKDEK